MMPADVLKIATKRFPHFITNDIVWFPHGKDCIRIQKGRSEYIFTCQNEKNWSLETADHYFDRLKGEQKK